MWECRSDVPRVTDELQSILPSPFPSLRGPGTRNPDDNSLFCIGASLYRIGKLKVGLDLLQDLGRGLEARQWRRSMDLHVERRMGVGASLVRILEDDQPEILDMVSLGRCLAESVTPTSRKVTTRNVPGLNGCVFPVVIETCRLAMPCNDSRGLRSAADYLWNVCPPLCWEMSTTRGHSLPLI